MKKIIPNIIYKSVLSRIKNIKKRNEYFNSLDAQSQRLEIAWDSLMLITNNIILANSGGYWDGKISDLSCSTKLSANKFQKKLWEQDTLQGCEVCARGAMMLSQIRLGNNIAPATEGVRSGSPDNLKGFSFADFLNMESEYEWSSFMHPYQADTAEKLANMCCNILVNGNFNTKDKTDYLIIEEK